MASLLQKLENNEATLLMYLAEELPADDRAEVDQMLAVDAGLRAELERIRLAHSGVIAALSALDAAVPLPVSESVGVRQISRMMKQWQADRFREPEPVVAPKGLRYAWWTYPAVAAAAILISTVVWWGVKPDGPSDGGSVAQVAPQTIQDLEDSFNTNDSDSAKLRDAEQQAMALTRSSDDTSALISGQDAPQ